MDPQKAKISDSRVLIKNALSSPHSLNLFHSDHTRAAWNRAVFDDTHIQAHRSRFCEHCKIPARAIASLDKGNFLKLHSRCLWCNPTEQCTVFDESLVCFFQIFTKSMVIYCAAVVLGHVFTAAPPLCWHLPFSLEPDFYSARIRASLWRLGKLRDSGNIQRLCGLKFGLR